MNMNKAEQTSDGNKKKLKLRRHLFCVRVCGAHNNNNNNTTPPTAATEK